MDWDALGGVAELLGAIGAIASLFYVASQIRRNSTALEAATNPGGVGFDATAIARSGPESGTRGGPGQSA
jgi:hypothetical protein